MRILAALRRYLRWVRLLSLLPVSLSLLVVAQSNLPAPSSAPDQPAVTGAPVTLTLQDALQRAKVHSPEFRSALTDARLAHEDKVQGRAGMLPNANFNTSMIYTESNNTRSNTPTYIANNGVHVYDEQATLHAELFSVTRHAEYRRAMAAEAAFAARREIAARSNARVDTQPPPYRNRLRTVGILRA